MTSISEMMQSHHSMVEVRSFKWPRRLMSIAQAQLLGRDRFGCWLGVRRGDPWWAADHSHTGVFEQTFVKLIPSGTFWTACFHPIDPVVDIDIVLPVHWAGGILEEVDLELDILQRADGNVEVRDQDVFEQVRQTYAMPTEIAREAETICERIRVLVEGGAEPFTMVGQEWLARFVADADRTHSKAVKHL